jgi:hypothetical protein
MLPADREIRRRREPRGRWRATTFAMGLSVVAASSAWAGPPFLTDDPEPVELGHWELYVASQWSVARHASSGSAPHLEVNYGVLPGLQLHAIVPATLAWQRGEPVHYGPGDIELGAKFRFVEEGAWRPQIGIFPLVLLPTGSELRGLGTGTTQVFLPLWVQKSFGCWTTYGGGGLLLASGGNAAVAGWLLQRELLGKLLVGTEAFFTIPTNGDPIETRVNVGLVVNFSEMHHLLVSAGPAFGGDARAQGYLAYQLTI